MTRVHLKGLTKAIPTGMLIDGSITVETPDTASEIVRVSGADLSSMETDGIPLNYEHLQPSDHGKESAKGKDTLGNEIVGKMVYYKKLFSKDDCEDERQLAYFERYHCVPQIYAIFRLFDGANHAGAKALASIIRDEVANGEQPSFRFSVEGSTLDRDPKNKNVITSSIVRAVAITKRPANKACTSGLLADPNAPPEWKARFPLSADQEPNLLASILDTNKSEPHPLYQPLGTPVEVVGSPILVDATHSRQALKRALSSVLKAKLVKAIMQETSLRKTLTASGTGACAPSALTNGAALAPEDLRSRRDLKSRALATLRDYNPPRFNKDEFRGLLKARLPEVDDDFLDHFADLAGDFRVKQAALKAGLKKAELPSSLACRIEHLTIELRKAAADISPELNKRIFFRFAGHDVTPGRASLPEGDFDLLHETPDAYYARPVGEVEPESLVRLPKSKEGTHYRVHSKPSVLVIDL